MRDSDFNVLCVWQVIYKNENNVQSFFKGTTSFSVVNDCWTGCLLKTKNSFFDGVRYWLVSLKVWCQMFLWFGTEPLVWSSICLTIPTISSSITSFVSKWYNWLSLSTNWFPTVSVIIVINWTWLPKLAWLLQPCTWCVVNSCKLWRGFNEDSNIPTKWATHGPVTIRCCCSSGFGLVRWHHRHPWHEIYFAHVPSLEPLLRRDWLSSEQWNWHFRTAVIPNDNVHQDWPCRNIPRWPSSIVDMVHVEASSCEFCECQCIRQVALTDISYTHKY